MLQRRLALLFLSTGLAALGSLSLPAAAQESGDPASKLKSIEGEIKTAEERKAALEKAAAKAEREAAELAARMVTVAKRIQTTESSATDLEDKIALLEVEEKNKREALGKRRDELVGLLAALERLALKPPATALLQPNEAITTARSAAVMGTLVPEIDRLAGALKAELEALNAVQADLSADRLALKGTVEKLAGERAELATLHEERAAVAAEASAAAKSEAAKLAKLAREATSLRDLVEKLEAKAAEERAEAERLARLQDAPVPVPRPTAPLDGKEFASAQGTLPYPVTGRIKVRFGEVEGVGHARGIRIDGRAGGQVVAPHDGQIVFAGPFRGYGQLLIIAHGGGYHSLIAGMQVLTAEVGQKVLSGEPVGTLGDGTSGPTELYLELRQGGKPVDPEPWLAKRTAAAGRGRR